MTSSGSSTGFAIGFIVGAAAGLAIGFLYAPRPGEETMELLKERAEEAREKVAGIVEKVKDTTVEVRKKAQERLGGAKE